MIFGIKGVRNGGVVGMGVHRLRRQIREGTSYSEQDRMVLFELYSTPVP